MNNDKGKLLIKSLKNEYIHVQAKVNFLSSMMDGNECGSSASVFFPNNEKENLRKEREICTQACISMRDAQASYSKWDMESKDLRESIKLINEVKIQKLSILSEKRTNNSSCMNLAAAHVNNHLGRDACNTMLQRQTESIQSLHEQLESLKSKLQSLKVENSSVRQSLKAKQVSSDCVESNAKEHQNFAQIEKLDTIVSWYSSATTTLSGISGISCRQVDPRLLAFYFNNVLTLIVRSFPCGRIFLWVNTSNCEIEAMTSQPTTFAELPQFLRNLKGKYDRSIMKLSFRYDIISYSDTSAILSLQLENCYSVDFFLGLKVEKAPLTIKSIQILDSRSPGGNLVDVGALTERITKLHGEEVNLFRCCDTLGKLITQDLMHENQ